MFKVVVTKRKLKREFVRSSSCLTSDTSIILKRYELSLNGNIRDITNSFCVIIPTTDTLAYAGEYALYKNFVLSSVHFYCT